MGKIALVFPGQGSEYVGMGRSLYDEYSVAKQTFEEASDVLGFDLKNLCFSGSQLELAKTVNMQLSIFTCSVAAFRVYMQEIGIAPIVSAGHSLGEYSALVCSNSLEFSEGLEILKLRGACVQEIVDKDIGQMTIVNNIDSAIVDLECKKNTCEGNIVTVSCFNSPRQVAISGHIDAVMRVEDILMDMGAIVTPLINSAPYHCKLMKDVCKKLKERLSMYSYKNSNWPVISNISALPYEKSEKFIENLSQQIECPVQWTRTIEYMKNIGVEIAIEIGPKIIISNFIRDISDAINTASFIEKNDMETIFNLIKNQK